MKRPTRWVLKTENMANPYMKKFTPSLSAMMDINLDLTRCLDIRYLKIWEHCQQANYVTFFNFIWRPNHTSISKFYWLAIFFHLFAFPGNDITFETRSNEKIKRYQIHEEHIFFKVHKTVKCFPRASRYIRYHHWDLQENSPQSARQKSKKKKVQNKSRTIFHHDSSWLPPQNPPKLIPRRGQPVLWGTCFHLWWLFLKSLFTTRNPSAFCHFLLRRRRSRTSLAAIW